MKQTSSIKNLARGLRHMSCWRVVCVERGNVLMDF